MSTSKLIVPLGKAVTKAASSIGTYQVNVNKVLWGSTNTQPKQTVSYNAVSSTLDYTSVPTSATKPTGGLIESGLFNALDTLNTVDLCNVLAYLTDMIPSQKLDKSKRAKQPTAAQSALYALQDEAELVQGYIDKFLAYPNVFIESYLGGPVNGNPPTAPNAITSSGAQPTSFSGSSTGITVSNPQQAASQSNAPIQGGTQVTAYNVYFLMKEIQNTFSFNSTSSLFTAQDKTLLTTVPGLGANLNIIDDFLGTINKYSDYRQLAPKEVQNIINKLNVIRSVCVVIQNSNFKGALALVGNFLSTDIRAQIQKLSDFLDPTQIIKYLKQINSALQSFINIARQVQGILNLGQFLIKLALVFNKVFKFIQELFSNNPLALITSISGAQVKFQNASDKAKDETDGISVLLNTVNSLLEVVVVFIRYILANTNELLHRLDLLLAQLEGCAAVQNSDIITQLQQTRSNLIDLQTQFATYITQYDSKTNANTAMFGIYDIRVVDEEVTDPGIINKRRRGIALNPDGQIVTQSDLTFATNTAVIIAEVKQKLMALHLVPSQMNQISTLDMNTLATSIDYLDSNDVLETDLNINASALNSASTVQSLGISEFISKLPGGAKFKQNSQAIVSTYSNTAKQQVSNQKSNVSGSIK